MLQVELEDGGVEQDGSIMVQGGIELQVLDDTQQVLCHDDKACTHDEPDHGEEWQLHDAQDEALRVAQNHENLHHDHAPHQRSQDQQQGIL